MSDRYGALKLWFEYVSFDIGLCLIESNILSLLPL